MGERKKTVYLFSVCLGVIFFSFTLIQYNHQSTRFSRYSIDMALDQNEFLLKDLKDVRDVKNTTTDSLSADLAETLTFESCLGVEEPAEDNEW